MEELQKGEIMQVPTITLKPSELLRALSSSMNWRDTEISITIPTITTWKNVLESTTTSFSECELSTELMITKPKNANQRDRSRKIALENLQVGKAEPQPACLPIRTRYNTENIPPPHRISPQARQKLKENAKQIDWENPYHHKIRAAITERTLPIISANIRLCAIDAAEDHPEENLNALQIIWDTGAHQTVISEELLSENFRQFLTDAVHKPYRAREATAVQLDAMSSPIKITAKPPQRNSIRTESRNQQYVCHHDA